MYLSSGLYLDILGLEHLTELHLIGTSLTRRQLTKFGMIYINQL